MKKTLTKIIAFCFSLTLLSGCSASDMSDSDNTTSDSGETEVVTSLDMIDNTKWQYNEDDDVYYQIGISYCEAPADSDYETLSVFVPGGYMSAEDNGDGTYTCQVNSDGAVGNYTAETAPFVMPVNTPGYSAQAALTEYSSFTDYTDEGIIYVHAGCRGRDAGAPAGVTDLKAAIRYIRYNSGNIAGDTEKLFSFGISGGGAQSALLGVTGDSELYDDYLESFGAVMGVSNAVYGSMAWCPITSLESADAAYEWNMGTTRSGLTDEEQTISDELTAAYAEYINALGLEDSDGNVLTIEQSDDGLWQSGSYYEFVKESIEDSLNQFLAETEFPYEAGSSGSEQGMGAGGRGEIGDLSDLEDGEVPDLGDAEPDEDIEVEIDGEIGDLPDRDDIDDTDEDSDSDETDYTQIDDISRTESDSGITISGTFETAQDYIDALNVNGEWVAYDESTNTATISSVQAFAQAMKTSSKSLGAFDQLDAGQGENVLFGYGDGEGAHFDSTLSEILAEIGSEYASDYSEDLAKTDSLGHTAEERLNMYSPLYYLMESSEGYQTSTVAQYFRIRTGICQSDTSVTTEFNLAQALENEGVDVDFAAVWGESHTQAETSGDSTSNFISWVHECMAD